MKNKNRNTATFAVVLLLICAALCLFGATVHAEGIVNAADITADPEPLSVNSLWLTGDTLHIQVTDKRTGADQTLELDLRQYAGSGDEYISVQAADRDGNKSVAVMFKNPYYVASAEIEPTSAAELTSAVEPTGAVEPTPAAEPNELVTAPTTRPFTPDGTGTVVDNVHEVDGKEFFSVKTDDGNVFYLIVDRQRATENVYLLNAVTEDDLYSLAKPGNGKTESGVPVTLPGLNGQIGGNGQNESVSTPEPNQEPAPTATPEPVKSTKAGASPGALIFIALAAAVVLGAGYYLKVRKPKKRKGDEEEDEAVDDDFGEDGGEDEDEELGEDKEGGGDDGRK